MAARRGNVKAVINFRVNMYADSREQLDKRLEAFTSALRQYGIDYDMHREERSQE